MSRSFHVRAAAVIAVIVVAGLTSAASAHGAGAESGGRHEAGQTSRTGLTKALVPYLKEQGFRVNPGYPILSSDDNCAKYSYPALHSCWGNNPVAPYVIPVVKAWPGERVGPTPPNVFGPVRPGYTPLPRLAPRDALVIYGRMPPPGKYMSLQTWVWSQPGRWTPKTYRTWANAPSRPFPIQFMFSTIPPDDPKARRTFAFTSLGDIVNNVVMQRASGSPFGKRRYFIITPSATTDRAVRRALHAQGVPDRHIFTTPIPSRYKGGRVGPLGMGKNALDFNTFFRFAIPDNQKAAERWWERLPLEVLRVRAPNVGPVRRYGPLTFERRRARSERHLEGDLKALVAAVCGRAGTDLGLESAGCAEPAPSSSIMPATNDDFGWVPPYCLKVNAWCGDNLSDAAFFGTQTLPLDSGQVYALVGTLATETRNATYVGLSVNDASTFLAPAGVTDSVLKGSADGYAGGVRNTGKFYVHYFTRDCDRIAPLLDRPEDCTSITTEMVPPEGDTSTPGDPALKGSFFIGLRDYIVPGTERAPDTSKLLRARILSFTAAP